MTAPTVNSYKRLVVGAPTQRRDLGAGLHHLRLQQPHADAAHPGAGRIEDRTVDGSCNPYLAAAVLLAAGLDGIERKLDPGDPNGLNLYERPRRSGAAGHRGAAGEPARRDPRARAERRPARRLGRARDEDYADYYIAASGGSGRRRTSRSRSGRSTATCSCSDRPRRRALARREIQLYARGARRRRVARSRKDAVLGGIVDVLTEATGCHACSRVHARRRRAAAAGRVARLRGPVGRGVDGARRGADGLGGAQQPAGVHPRERDGRPALQVRAGARGGALPVDGGGADRARARAT